MSKVVKIFDESGLEDLIDCELGGQNYELIHGLLNHTRALEAMLRKHEMGNMEIPVCLECGRDNLQGHSPDCELAKLLD